MNNVISLAEKRKEKQKQFLDKLSLLYDVIADARLSRIDCLFLIEFVSLYIERDGPFNEYVDDKGKRAAIEKLIDFGYLEKTEPFDWICEESFLGFSVGESLGLFQEIRIRSGRHE